MEIDKTIPELFFDRMIAEGATLHIWFRGAKFKRMTTKLKVRGTIHDATFEEQNQWLFETFDPSIELKQIFYRNNSSITEWLDQKRVEWCKKHGVEP